ncbi:MAG: ion channel [Caulobacteraceae bacterium]
MRQKRQRVALVADLAGDGPSDTVFRGQPKGGWRDAYHWLLTIPLAAFFAVFAAWYLAMNAVFGVIYLLVGGVTGMARADFADAFFFSTETLSTVGYGAMAPVSLAAHLVVTAELFVGLFNLAIVTGLLFARFSRPTARVMFSDWAVVTPHEGARTLIFRAANRRRNRIVEAEVSVSVLRDTTTLEGEPLRRFETLATTRPRTPIFYLTWQVMHVIDEASPLFGETSESLAASSAQIVVVLRGLDETFSQTIHARTSYGAERIAWDRKLAPIFSTETDGRRVIDLARFHDIV